MTVVERALKPFTARLRLVRAVRWAAVGLFTGAAAALCVRAASYLWPMPSALLICALTALAVPALFVLAGLLCPYDVTYAARMVDNRGLEARAQTAIMLKESNTPMALLQRGDTLKCLEEADPRELFPVKPSKLPLLGALACALLFGASFIIANPQTSVLQARAAYRADMAKQAELVDDAARKLDAADPQAPELRKLLGDLSRELRSSEDAKDSLMALDRAEKGMESMSKDAQTDAYDAMEKNGLGELAKTLQANDSQKAKELLEKLKQSGDDKLLNAAAQSAATASAKANFQSAMQALNAGNASQAAQCLQNALGGQCASMAQAMALSCSIRAAVAQSGASKLAAQGGSSAAAGTSGTGAGASLGSTNEDGGYGGLPRTSTSTGTEKPGKRVAEYEPIYDPTRLNVEGVQTNERGKQGEGEIIEAEAGQGIGSADGAVPYNEVLAEYGQKAVEAAQSGELPPYAQKWVEDYFRLLSE